MIRLTKYLSNTFFISKQKQSKNTSLNRIKFSFSIVHTSKLCISIDKKKTRIFPYWNRWIRHFSDILFGHLQQQQQYNVNSFEPNAKRKYIRFLFILVQCSQSICFVHGMLQHSTFTAIFIVRSASFNKMILSKPNTLSSI